MTLSQPNKRHRLSMNPARVLLLTTLEKEEDGLKMPDEAASMDFSEAAREEMEVLFEAKNSDCFI